MGGRKEGEKNTDRQRKRHMYREIRVEETNQMNVAVKVRVWGRA